MAESVVSVALETLRDLLVEEAKFLHGVSDQVEEVQTELIRMKAFLKDADARVHKDARVQNWVREIKKIAYKAEDVLETFAVKVASRREGTGMRRILHRFACILGEFFALHNVGSEIGNIKNQISSLTQSLTTYGVRDINIGESSSYVENHENHSRQTYGHQVEEFFVGMEKDLRQLVSLVINRDRQYPVISICGMGGLGKTTLARKVYNNFDVRREFEGFAWACVTQQCDSKSILLDVLTQLKGRDSNRVTTMERELVRELYGFLKDKKCLVVIDDIWKNDDWDRLSPAFPLVEADTKILVTTRIKDVAEKGFMHTLDYLSEDEGWELLHKIAFATKEDANIVTLMKLVESLGREMVRKCGCLPLAISVLGGVLSKKVSVAEWEMVNENINLYLNAGEGNGGSLGVTARMLAFSYNELPYYLKPCFLYLGNFPEDADIDVEKLYLMWMAEAMILSEHRRNQSEPMMDVAQRYMCELANRCMVQVQQEDLKGPYRRFRSCRLHDLMRDMCISMVKEENFLEVLDLRGAKQHVQSPSTSNDAYTYRVAFQVDEYSESIGSHLRRLSIKDARSVFVLCERYTTVLNDITNFKYLKSLRVLHFVNCDFRETELPKEIGELVLLRYLSLGHCWLTKVPSCIGKLTYLQTLDLRVNYCGDEIKSSICFSKLRRLKHLFLGPFGGSKMLRLNGLSELETLEGFSDAYNDPADIFKLMNIRHLEASVSSHESISVLMNYTETKGIHLRSMELSIFCELDSEEGSSLLKKVFSCHYINHLDISRSLGKLPSYNHGDISNFSFLPNLTKLSLYGTYIVEDGMQTLEKLPSLRVLRLSCDAFVGREMICHSKGFPQLRRLHLSSLYKLEKWRVDSGAMPNLSHLRIDFCLNLEMIPDGLRLISTLQELTLFDMDFRFTSRVTVVDGREGDDFDKVRHVPSIIILDTWSS